MKPRKRKLVAVLVLVDLLLAILMWWRATAAIDYAAERLSEILNINLERLNEQKEKNAN